MTAINGAGTSPADKRFRKAVDDVTVPGLVAGWHSLHSRFGTLPLTEILAPAVKLAYEGVVPGADVARAVDEQRERLKRGGAGEWAETLASGSGDRTRQVELSDLLADIAHRGPAAFYEGPMAEAIAAAVGKAGGCLTAADLATHETAVGDPLRSELFGLSLMIQPPPTQGVLLALVANHLTAQDRLDGAVLQHAAIELTAAAFEFRARVLEGEGLLDQSLPLDLTRASRRPGPRPYLHTAGVAAADASGMVVSSLVSLIDSFGSCILVPEGGFILNNRALDFTVAPNDAGPGKYPVHTLSPAMVVKGDDVIGLATPGADGQVQTLLQIIVQIAKGADRAQAIDAPRWRSEDGKLLLETSRPDRLALATMGHDTVELAGGDPRFGAVVSTAIIDGNPAACSDWRGEVWSGVA